jgi:sarcosine oxidase subunit delta
MSFQMTCPNCGKRSASEFLCRGELRERPPMDASFREWADYVYLRDNFRGQQLEWWYHRNGCQLWFVVERDTTQNTNHRIITSST